MSDATPALLAAVCDRPAAALLERLVGEVAWLRGRVADLERRMGEVGGKGASEPLGTPSAGPDGLALALNGRLAAVLVAGGYSSADEVRAAADGDLLAVRGVDAKALKLIREKVGREQAGGSRE